MASVLKTKCPSCGVEDGPCLIENGQEMFHLSRKRAAYPTTYEHPDCEECKKLKDAMVYAEDSVGGFRLPGAYKPRSRWPRRYRDEASRLKRNSNLARATYELHLVQAHDDESRKSSVGKNLDVVLREGRLKP
jgi:hypothetical protein